MDRPTHVIVVAGKILRTLHPSPLGALVAVHNGDSLTQREISDIVGRTQPTVSTYFQSFETLPVPLTVKRGQRNTITETGKKVIALVRRVFANLGPDFSSIDWSDETDRDTVSSLLSPLHDSRSDGPFFILDSIYDRSDLDGLLGKPQPVWLDDVVNDVEARHRESGGSTTLKQVRQTVKRFDNAGDLTVDGNRLTLDEKGQEHGRLLNELVQFLKEREQIQTDDPTEREGTIDPGEGSTDISNASPSELEDDLGQTHGSITQQRQGQGFLGAQRPSVADQPLVRETPITVLTYCLHPTGEAPSDEKSRLQPLPVLALTALSANELADRVEEVIDEYGGDAQLVPYWALQTDTGLYPLGPVGNPSAAESEFENG